MPFCLLLLLMTRSFAQDPGEPAPTVPPVVDTPIPAEPVPDTPTPPDPQAEFDAARQEYLLGEHEHAREMFLALIARREQIPFSVWVDAMIYLAEIAHQAGDVVARDALFRAVLSEDLDVQISAIDHPLDLIGAFQVVRDTLRSERLVTPPPPMKKLRYPWWGFAPFGVPQFEQDRPVRGAVFATLQAGAAASTIASWVWIDRLSQPLDDTELQNQRREDAKVVRNAMNVPSAVGFYLLWGGSVLDGNLTWRKAPPLQVTLLPTPGGVAVVGQF